MLNGYTVYHGQSIKMTSYLSELGYTCNLQDNPADFALDILNKINNTPTMVNLFNNNIQFPLDDSTSDILFSSEELKARKLNRSFLSDFLYVSQRTFRNALRNSALLAWQIAVAIILGLLTGLLYDQIPGQGVQNRLCGILLLLSIKSLVQLQLLNHLLKKELYSFM